ncbi:cytochrome c oxidase subunit 3, partial (mitochondrion) [Aspergillus verrucosus]
CTRNYRNSILSSGIMTFSCISFNRSPSPWLRIRNIILTLCRRGLIILIYFSLLLR